MKIFKTLPSLTLPIALPLCGWIAFVIGGNLFL